MPRLVRACSVFAAVAVVLLATATPARAEAPSLAPGAMAFWGPPTAPPPHRIIQQPIVQVPGEPHAHHASRSYPSGQSHREWTGGGGTLAAPSLQGVWRSPYAYGYFGASGSRHWHRHFGRRQAYTQWTLK